MAAAITSAGNTQLKIFLMVTNINNSNQQFTADLNELLIFAITGRESVERPKELDGGYFDEFFKTVSRMYITQEELDTYDYMIRDEVQIAAEKEFLARKKFAEGKAEGKAEVVSRMKEMGLSLEQISRFTGLSEDAVSAM